MNLPFINLKKEELKRLVKPFIFVFLISFLIINWSEIYWLFHYRAVLGAASNFFRKAQAEISSSFFSENQIATFPYSEKENTLEISQLGIVAPIIHMENSNEKDLHEALDRGVVLFPNSALPGEIGETIILGHSAPPNWPKIKYDWVFSRLNELNGGEEITIHFNHRKYTYSVAKKAFLNRGEAIPQSDLTNYKNTLVLISCWPPGKDLKRIAVEAELR